VVGSQPRPNHRGTILNSDDDARKREYPALKAIDTAYDGFLFRSRTEAKWAVLFRFLEIEFQYEPEGLELSTGDWYIPDFYLPQVNLFAEVKPFAPTPTERRKVIALVHDTERGCLVLDGHPTYKTYTGYTWDSGDVTEAEYLLDIDMHGRRYYCDERRFFANPGILSAECEFSSPYREAVTLARMERFNGRRFPSLGDEPFNALEGDMNA
jgi:hypothetical protein